MTLYALTAHDTNIIDCISRDQNTIIIFSYLQYIDLEIAAQVIITMCIMHTSQQRHKRHQQNINVVCSRDI